MSEGDPNKTYDWLVRRVEAHVDTQRIEANLLSYKRSLQGEEPALPGAGGSGPPQPKRDCRFWKAGTCKAGKDCPFNHPPKGPPPKAKAKATPKGGGGMPCWNFHDGKCTKENCTREHRALTQQEIKENNAKQAEQKASPKGAPAVPKWSDNPCGLWTRTKSCTRGLDCLYMHAGQEKEQKAHRAKAKPAAKPRAKSRGPGS